MDKENGMISHSGKGSGNLLVSREKWSLDSLHLQQDGEGHGRE
jgi:hypothetical protein